MFYEFTNDIIFMKSQQNQNREFVMDLFNCQ